MTRTAATVTARIVNGFVTLEDNGDPELRQAGRDGLSEDDLQRLGNGGGARPQAIGGNPAGVVLDADGLSDAQMQKVDPSQYTLRQRERDYDIIFSGYRTFVGAGTGLYQLYGSENADVSLFNPAGFSSPLVDALIKTALEAEEKETETAALTALDRVLRHEFFMVPAYYKADNWLAYFDMFRHPQDMPPFAVGQMDFWWADAAREAELKAAGALR